jgi:hypothetical protein
VTLRSHTVFLVIGTVCRHGAFGFCCLPLRLRPDARTLYCSYRYVLFVSEEEEGVGSQSSPTGPAGILRMASGNVHKLLCGRG